MTPEEADNLDANQVKLINIIREDPKLAELAHQFLRICEALDGSPECILIRGKENPEDGLAELVKGLGIELPERDG